MQRRTWSTRRPGRSRERRQASPLEYSTPHAAGATGSQMGDTGGDLHGQLPAGYATDACHGTARAATAAVAGYTAGWAVGAVSLACPLAGTGGSDMKILVVGAGATGGWFGARLALAGRDVTFLVRPGRAAVLRERGLRLAGLDDDVFTPRTVTAAELDGRYDVVLLAVKALALEQAMADLAPAVGPGTVIVPFLNGMAHVDTLTRPLRRPGARRRHPDRHDDRPGRGDRAAGAVREPGGRGAGRDREPTREGAGRAARRGRLRRRRSPRRSSRPSGTSGSSSSRSAH